MKISNKNMEISFQTKGAEINSILLNGKERTNASRKFWGNVNPTLFPIVGFLVDGHYTHNGKKYEMKQHGLSRLSEYKVVDQGDRHIFFKLESDGDTWEQFPFDFQLLTKYYLTDQNEVVIIHEVSNTGSETFNYALGTHPSFAVDNVANYELEVVGNYKNESVTFAPNNQGVSNETFAVPFENNVLDLDFDYYEHNSIVLKDVEIEKSILRKKDHSEEIIVNHGDFNRHLVVWSPSKDADFICVEPEWSLADLVGGPYELADKPYTLTIGPDETQVFQYSYQFVK